MSITVEMRTLEEGGPPIEAMSEEEKGRRLRALIQAKWGTDEGG
jgi:hypothetical protein